ncbi:MAG: hypothetical protein IJP03_05365, partial [Christensenellaceae bacterium]|nr:hypothetical protein [Christensenellaceae bacterium]
MELSKQTRQYLRRLYHRGKGPLARWADRILGSIAVFFILFCLFWMLHIGLARSAIGAGVLVALGNIALLWRRRSGFEKFMEKQLKECRDQLALEKLLLLPRADFQKLCLSLFQQKCSSPPAPVLGGWYFAEEKTFGYAFRNHPLQPIGVGQLLLLQRRLKRCNARRLLLFSTAPYEDNADLFAHRLGAAVLFFGPDELFALNSPLLYIAKEQAMEALDAKAVRLSAKEAAAGF